MNKPKARPFRLRARGSEPPESVIATELADGEGAMAKVYALPGDTEVLKRFRDETPEEAARLAGMGPKIEAMLARPPQMQIHHQGKRRFVQIAWPQRAVIDRKGGIVGFTMPRISADAVPMTAIFSKRNREARGLRHDLAFRTYVALNLSNVINYVRAAGHLVMDFNPKNFVIDRSDGWVGLLDCDGFAIFDGSALIPADAVKPDEVAPEFRDPQDEGSYDVRALDDRQTRFGLAVTLFRLFNSGNSPAAGRHLDANEPSGENKRIAQRLFSVHPDRAGLEPPGDITFLFEDETLALFRQAFLGPDDQRPSPSEWAAHFRRLVNGSLRPCPANPGDYHFSKPCLHCGYQPPLQASAPYRPPAPAKPSQAVSRAAVPRSRPAGAPAAPKPPISAPPTSAVPTQGTPATPVKTTGKPPMPMWKRVSIFGGCALVAIAANRLINSGTKVEKPPPRPVASASPSPPKATPAKRPAPAPAPAAQPVPNAMLAVAALNINLRPTAEGGAPLGKLVRGAQVEALEEGEKFVKVRTSAGEVGWLPRDYLIHATDLPRLDKLTPQAYIQSRRNDSALARLRTQLEASSSQRLQLLRAIQSGATDVGADIGRLEASRRISVPADVSAARWFNASAEAARNERNFSESREFFRAAAEADPANPTYHSGIGFVSYELGDFDTMAEEGAILLVLAPRSTNAWYINGFAWAADLRVDRRMPVTAFHLAQVFSEDAPKTRQRMAAEAKRKSGSPVGLALEAALSGPPAPAPAPASPPVQAALPPVPASAPAPMMQAAPARPTIRDLGSLMDRARDRRWGEIDQMVSAMKARGNGQPGNEAAARNALDDGQRALNAFQYQQAAEAFRRAVAADPADPLLHRKLGEAYAALGQTGPATNAYVQALLIDPGSGYAWAMLSHQMALAGNPPDDVWMALRLALLFEPNRQSLVRWIRSNTSNERLGPAYRGVHQRVLQEVAKIPPP
ncbi:hypothetical protein GCM10023165_28630 [Variovorax defluvii]|uniref:Tetratricopeptide repeat protein n=1 Tax=Variovorax defluvii TaxID=913761 RepID=A0ABP8HUZ8_9BURK